MYKRDLMLEEIHKIRREMWETSGHDPHSLIENIQKEAKEFIEECGYSYVDTQDSYRKVVKSDSQR